ncbi:hypothetical protein CONPUDRAFT_119066 [Coniophora puteana RWD-64-598 SS2]|uniref:3-oxo-5-alpha-steroid 4-dehydrogenase C-terminal domain-containing protein n=1 Tax=Coniophora puteana (strain RWD-64-598) TaxID=741705 RepID=A0A5M3MX39_CONPW|nr:uncharacterized protein CONPUDRAFT_119066 [Coniophora puteana RWD-64-598 SS2]EIW83696.1 hypothetical protein CONPUDRAFT_119066 [Coniophora puteana RWD-64-598 SS2]
MTHPLYDVGRMCLFFIPSFFCPLTFFSDAPFGRFARSGNSIFILDGIKVWIVMELVAPTALLYSLIYRPLSAGESSLPLSGPQLLVVALFLIHYFHRAIISPLRTPSRSKSHAGILLSGSSFNSFNGTLLGTYLSSDFAHAYLKDAFSRPLFWLGVAVWALGFWYNIVHDEVLLDLRRHAQAKGKAKKGALDAENKDYYAIPHGYLYRWISYPNYLCEWIEWIGWAAAGAPLPDFSSFGSVLRTILPPWIMVWGAVVLMLPRAYRGHVWYHEKFPEYPKDRKAVIPYLY